MLYNTYLYSICLPGKIKNAKIVYPTLFKDFVEVMYSKLSGSDIINTLLALFEITYYTLPHLILNSILSIFYISSGTKPNYLTNLQKISKYSSIFLKL